MHDMLYVGGRASQCEEVKLFVCECVYHDHTPRKQY